MAMERLRNELNSLVNRGMDKHLRLAVTGLSRSGKTAFITALVNQLLSIHTGARLPLFSAVREERLLGVKRVPQRDFGIPRFTYDEGLAQLYGSPPVWPTPTRGVSEIRLALRFRSRDSLLRHFKETSTLYLEIVDYPGEWLLDLPMLAQDYLSWSRQMTGLLTGQRQAWSEKWRALCAGLDPLAPANENRLGGGAPPPGAAMKTGWRRSPPPGLSTFISASVKGCTLSSRGDLYCRAIWQAHQHYSSSRGRTLMAPARRSWRRPAGIPTPGCCANAINTIATT